MCVDRILGTASCHSFNAIPGKDCVNGLRNTVWGSYMGCVVSWAEIFSKGLLHPVLCPLWPGSPKLQPHIPSPLHSHCHFNDEEIEAQKH